MYQENRKGHALRFCKRKDKGEFPFFLQYMQRWKSRIKRDGNKPPSNTILSTVTAQGTGQGFLKKRDGISSHIVSFKSPTCRRMSKRHRSPSCTAWSFASPAMEKTACQRNKGPATNSSSGRNSQEEPKHKIHTKKKSVWGGRNRRGRPGIMHGVQSAKPRNQPWEIPTLKGHHNLFCLPALLLLKKSGRRGAGFPGNDDSCRLSLPPRFCWRVARGDFLLVYLSTTLRCQFLPPGRIRETSAIKLTMSKTPEL